MIPEGNYKARAIASDIGVSQAKATPYVKVTFLLEGGEEAIDWYGYLSSSEKAQERFVKDLRTLGYKGHDPEELKGLDQEQVGAFLPAQVSLKIEHEEYQGRVRPRVRYVNPASRPVPSGSSLFGDLRAAFAAAPPEGTPPPKAGPKARPAPVSEDDIPFLPRPIPTPAREASANRGPGLAALEAPEMENFKKTVEQIAEDMSVNFFGYPKAVPCASQRLTGEATQQALDSAVRLGKMADAVRALLADVESQHGEKMDFCNAPRCRRLAMYNDGDMAACDEHQGILVAGDIEDMSYAPFVRTLRAMIEGKPGEPCGAVERLKVENEALRAALASDGEAMANLCGLLGLTDAVVSREEGQQMVHAAVKKLKVERDEMRSAARALLAELDKEARSCGKCYRLATVAEGLPRGGFVFACDKHATPPSTEWQDDPCQNYPTNVAAPLRALRALLEGKP